MLEKRRVYLGRHGLPETTRKYQQVIAQWLSNGQRLEVPPDELTITELIDRYVAHVEEYYRSPATGAPSSQAHVEKCALRALNEVFGNTLAVDFGPKALRALMNVWIDRGHCRTAVNKYAVIVRRCFRWAVANELIPAGVHQALTALPGLRAGRTSAVEHEPVKAVPESHVNAIEPFLPRVLWLAVQLQIRCGAGSDEILSLRPMDINTSGPVWTATLSRHKTAHHGRARVLCFGPRCQTILRELMQACGIADYIFDPHRAIVERSAAAPKNRRENQPESPRKTDRVVGDRYTPASYRRAVQRAWAVARSSRRNAKRATATSGRTALGTCRKEREKGAVLQASCEL